MIKETSENAFYYSSNFYIKIPELHLNKDNVTSTVYYHNYK